LPVPRRRRCGNRIWRDGDYPARRQRARQRSHRRRGRARRVHDLYWRPALPSLMKLLVIGGGGREHALAWKLAHSPRVQKVFVAPGNGGTALEPGLENLSLTDTKDLLAFAKRESIQLAVVGPEAPLAAGVVDTFQEAGLRIFG